MQQYSEYYISEKIGVKKPILLIDDLTIDESKAVSKCILGAEYPFWNCHFIGNPVMPGTYMLEMIAQSAAFFEMEITGCSKVPIIISITNVRFLREVKPGQTVEAEIILKKISGKYYTINGKMNYAGKCACKAEMVHYIKE